MSTQNLTPPVLSGIVKPDRRRTYLHYLARIGLVVLPILLSVVLFIYRDQLREFATYGYLGIFIISILGNATLIFPIPAVLAAFVGGALYNPWIVTVVSGAGQAIGELTGFWVGFGGRDFVDRLPAYKRIESWMHRYADLVIFVFAAIPNPIFDLGGIAAGATGMPWWRFLLFCFLGKMVKAFVMAFIGLQTGTWLDQFLH